MIVPFAILVYLCFFTGDPSKEEPVRDVLRLVGMVILALCCVAVVLRVLAAAIL